MYINGFYKRIMSYIYIYIHIYIYKDMKGYGKVHRLDSGPGVEGLAITLV